MFYDRMNGYEDARWQNAFPGGNAALKAHKRGPKHQSRLAGHQAATVVRLITDRCPDQLKLPFALWTRQAVCELIEKPICHSNFGLDGRSLFETLGLYAAKTAAACLRAKSAGSVAMAGAGVPCDSPAGPHRTCPNPLGRRNGNVFRSSGRTQVWSQGTYTSHSRNRSAVWLPYDLDGHQPRSFGL